VPVARALAAAGWWVAVASSDRLAPARFSRRCARFLRVPPSSSPEFVESVLRAARLCSAAAVFPLEDRTIQRLLDRGPTERPVAPLPPGRCYRAAFDKWKTIQIAERADVDRPRTVSLSDTKIADAVDATGLPAILKPRRGYGAHGVRLVRSLQELSQVLRSRPKSELLLQEFVPHGGAGGLCALVPQKGAPVTFTFLRLREYPPSGGPSTLRVAKRVREIEDAGLRLLKAMDWRGLAMVEFRRHARTGRWILMEINGRVWGSVALAIEAGVNFPALALEDAMGASVPQPRWRSNVLCRWWLGDMLHLLARRRLVRLALEPLLLPFLGVRHDTLSVKDPLPFLTTLLGAPLVMIEKRAKLWGRGW